MWFRLLLAGVGLAGILGACAVVDPVDSRYDTVSRSLAKARNESIFLNLIRASHDYPLSFTTVANVTPTMTNTTNVALPTFLFGPRIPTGTTPLFTPGRDVIVNNTTAGNSTAISTNFNVSTQETSAFYEGFLKPIDLTTLDYFIRQGYSRELLFWLFADSVEISAGGKTFGYHYNPPTDYGCPKNQATALCFFDFIQIATASGLTVEEKTVQKSSGGGKSGDSGGGSSSSKPTTTVYPRFCFNPVLGQQAERAMGSDRFNHIFSVLHMGPGAFNPKCGSKWDPQKEANTAQPDTFALSVGPSTFRITPRSAYGVFEFLGMLIKMQRDHPASPEGIYIPPGRPEVTAMPPELTTVLDDPKLITVRKDTGVPCFSHTWFEDGDYCVPDDAATTKRIFSLLAQLIAIQTAAADLSITPVVRIIQ